MGSPKASGTRSLRFFLGTHELQWARFADVPLFLSYRRFQRRATYPRATGPWALDSGAFSEIAQHGRWTIGPREYAQGVRRCRDEVGRMQWAAIQDWMCEPAMLKRTGLTVSMHQRRTIQSLLDLRDCAPEVPWIPVLQGYALRDYLDHVAMYARAKIDLTREPLVGLGSVCRRQATDEIREIVTRLAGGGIRLHGFGVKILGLAQYARYLSSADSMAWSFDARRAPPLPGCSHSNCANCWRYARRWYARVRGLIDAQPRNV